MSDLFKIKSCDGCNIKIENLSVSRNDHLVLKNVNLTLHCGDVLAMIGKNGAGKTTLVKAILGEIEYCGKITFVNKCGCGVAHTRIGYVPQHFYFDSNSPITVRDFLLAFYCDRPIIFVSKKKLEKVITGILQKVECQHLANRRLCELSGGEIQRIVLATAINPVPDLLIFDEPVSGVDQRGIDMFYDIVLTLRQQHHITILLISHDLKSIKKYTDKIFIVTNGTIEQSSANAIFNTKIF